MNRSVYLLATLFFCLSGYLIHQRNQYNDEYFIKPGINKNLWKVTVAMEATGSGDRAKIRMTIPKSNTHQTIYNEIFENDDLVFYTRDRELTGNRIGFWRSQLLRSTKNINYTFSAQLKETTYYLPYYVQIEEKPLEYFPKHMHIFLNPSEYIQSDNQAMKKLKKKIIGKEKSAAEITRKIYDYIRANVTYRSEKGSKDATATLDKLIADCGGQARLFAALSRSAGIPSRIAGGLILEPGVKKITHVWIENYIGDEWIPFDTVNNHFAKLPDHYLVLYHGDYSLIKHLGMKKFDYYFLIQKESIPPVNIPWSLHVLPAQFQGLVQILLLIPIGALLVAFFRVVIGIPTFGTFTPIILVLAFREMPFTLGMSCLVGIVLVGYVLRIFLDYFKILIVPRLAIIVCSVVIMVIGLMFLAVYANKNIFLFISLFPMVILTWMIERFSVLQIEDGTISALKAIFGTAAVSACFYYLVDLTSAEVYMFSYPELLFSVIGALLLLGRYSGFRLLEIKRFWELYRVLKSKKHKKADA